jgi:chaperonin GroES
MTNLQKLAAWSKRDNLAGDQDDTFLAKLADDVIRNYEEDEGSRAAWLKKSKYAMDHALQVTTPRPGASNVKYPLLTVAALQFHARAYPEIIKGQDAVKAKVTGQDQDGAKQQQAKRIADFMNWQLFEEMSEWEEEMDKIILALPIEGCEFKKMYFDPNLGRNVSEWVRPKNLIVANDTRSLDTCPRVTHRLYMYPYQIAEKQRSGVWSDVDLKIDTDDDNDELLQEILEQHLLMDLDGDGLKEPYVVTVHKDSQEVVRIKADYHPEDITVSKDGNTMRIDKLVFRGVPAETVVEQLKGAKITRIDRFNHFEKFSFIPSPDGSFYDVGFGQLIGPLTDVVDTTINQLIDAGTLQNLGGGFVRRGMNINGRRGEVRFQMGEYKEVDVPSSMDIRGMIMPIPTPQPSVTLFNLLNTTIQGVKDITSVQDIFTGGQQQNETATTTLARIDQGLKVFTAIYKRILRATGKEFKKLYRLNSIYLPEETYFSVLDDNRQEVMSLKDFRNDGTDVQPSADPSVSSVMLRQAKAELLLQHLGNPMINGEEIMRRYFEAMELDNIDKLFVPEEQRNQPSPEMIKMQVELLESKAKTAKTYEETQVVKANVIKTYAQAVEAIANAESKEAGSQLAMYRQQMESMIKQFEVSNGQGNTQGMAGAPGNGVAPGAAQQGPAAMPDQGAGGFGPAGPESIPGIEGGGLQ